ncbi:MAG: hydrogenase maturation nickel metallochaperone HypA [Bryobacteraceae bacterium]|jgi:hydrogenase nickel incorporation protein HypA/HybF
MIEETIRPIMHEMSIAASMLETVQAEAVRHKAHVRAVGVKIGQLSGVDTESLRFCFDALVQDTDLAPLKLEIEALPWRNRCRQCARDFAVEEFRTECPQCGSPETELSAGNELEFAYMEIDE